MSTPYDETELQNLLYSIRRPFSDRDKLMDERRDIRHRRTPTTGPAGLKVLNPDAHTDYRSPLPGFVVSRLVNRLGENDVEMAVKVRNPRGLPTLFAQAEKLEDWVRGLQKQLDPLGECDAAVREHQAQDGKGWFELEFLTGFHPPNKGDMSNEEFDAAVLDAQQAYGVPVALSAPDPRSLYYAPLQGRPKVVCKVVNVPLYDTRQMYSMDRFRIAYLGEMSYDEKGMLKGKLQKETILGGQLPPAPTSAEFGILVRLIIIATDDYIYHCMSPFPGVQGTTGLQAWDMGQTSNATTIPLTLLKAYPNPIGMVPFFPAKARPTRDMNPAYADEPLAMEVLDLAPFINTQRETMLIRGRIQANAPISFHPDRPGPGTDQVTPKASNVEWKPGIIEAEGTFAPIELPDMPDFIAMGQELTTEFNSYNQSLMGAAQQGLIGRSTPAWGMMQLNEEQNGMLKPAQNGRAAAWHDVIVGALKVCKKHAKDGPLWVCTDTLNSDAPQKGYQSTMLSITEDDLSIPYDLVITIHGETQSQRAALTEYGRQLRQEGTLSQETYETDYVSIQDRVAEQARKDQEAIEKPMRMAAYKIGAIIGFMELRATYGPLVDMVAQPILDAMGVTPQDIAASNGGATAPPAAEGPGQAAPGAMGGTPLMDSLKMPGQGMGLSLQNYGGARNIAQPREGLQGAS